MRARTAVMSSINLLSVRCTRFFDLKVEGEAGKCLVLYDHFAVGIMLCL
jgi:hypothetical protein